MTTREPTTELLRQLIEIMRQSQTRRLSTARRRPVKPPARQSVVPLRLAKS